MNLLNESCFGFCPQKIYSFAYSLAQMNRYIELSHFQQFFLLRQNLLLGTCRGRQSAGEKLARCGDCAVCDHYNVLHHRHCCSHFNAMYVALIMILVVGSKLQKITFELSSYNVWNQTFICQKDAKLWWIFDHFNCSVTKFYKKKWPINCKLYLDSF